MKGIRDLMPSGVYLAYVPQDQQWIMTGNLDIYLINNTDHDIFTASSSKTRTVAFPGLTTDP
jgi:hypothetical protein